LIQIKVTKLNHYEENYQQRVEDARHKEVGKLQKELFVWALSLVVTVISPSLAAAATFIVYVFSNESHILTAAETFTVLLLFNALRFPINYFGRLLGRLAQALTSIDRIADFLEREVRSKEGEEEETKNNNDSNHNNSHLVGAGGDDTGDAEPQPVVTVKNAAFRIGAQTSLLDPALSSPFISNGSSRASQKESGFQVSGVEFSLRKGEMLALVGAVGSGKSTIINGLISEVLAVPGATISLKGKVAYVSQTAFIMNTTLRENVLFGQPFELERYEKVLEACCLWHDVELLGKAGDLTEIGERGVTLSGGKISWDSFLLAYNS